MSKPVLGNTSIGVTLNGEQVGPAAQKIGKDISAGLGGVADREAARLAALRGEMEKLARAADAFGQKVRKTQRSGLGPLVGPAGLGLGANPGQFAAFPGGTAGRHPTAPGMGLLANPPADRMLAAMAAAAAAPLKEFTGRMNSVLAGGLDKSFGSLINETAAANAAMRKVNFALLAAANKATAFGDKINATAAANASRGPAFGLLSQASARPTFGSLINSTLSANAAKGPAFGLLATAAYKPTFGDQINSTLAENAARQAAADARQRRFENVQLPASRRGQNAGYGPAFDPMDWFRRHQQGESRRAMLGNVTGAIGRGIDGAVGFGQSFGGAGKMAAGVATAPLNFLRDMTAVAGGVALDKMLFRIADGINAVAKAAVENAVEFERLGVAFEVLTGSVGRGQKLFEDVQGLAVSTPFTVKELASQTKLLKSYGVATDDLIDTIKRLGDVASGTGVDLGRITLAYGQVMSKRRFQAGELRQFTEAGVSAQSFADAAGLSVPALLSQMEEGRVSSRVVQKAFRQMTGAGGQFFGMNERLQNTVGGRMRGLVETGQIFAGKVGGSFFQNFGVADSLKGLTEKLNNISLPGIDAWVGRMADGLEPLGQRFGMLTATFSDLSGKVYDALPTWQQFGDAVDDFFTTSLPVLIGSVKAYAKVAVDAGATVITIGDAMVRAFGKGMGGKAGGGFDWLGATVPGVGLAGMAFGSITGLDQQTRDRLAGGVADIAQIEGLRRLLNEGIDGIPNNPFAGPRPGRTGRTFASAAAAKTNAIGGVFGGFANADPGEIAKGEKARLADAAKKVADSLVDAAEMASPGITRVLEEAIGVKPLSATERFRQAAEAMRVGEELTAKGLPGGLTPDQAMRGRAAAFRDLREAVKPAERQLAPLLGSNTVASESALSRAVLQSQGKQTDPAKELARLLEEANKLAAREAEETKRVGDAVKELANGLAVGVGRGGN